MLKHLKSRTKEWWMTRLLLTSFILTSAFMQPGVAMLIVLPLNAALMLGATLLARRLNG